MDGHFIRKRNNPQVSALQLGDFAPEPIAIVLLRFGSERLVENSRASLLLDVWTFAKHFLLEVLRKAVLSHLKACAMLGA